MTTPASSPSKSAWPFASVLLALTLVTGIPLAYMTIAWTSAMRTAPERIALGLAEAVRPKVDVHQVVMTTLDEAHRTSKLVVYQASMDVDVTRDESASSWGMYWGTNTARVVARDAKVQYVIDLSELGTGDFQYDSAAKTLTVTLPKPHLDTTMVAIDPARIATVDLRGGWARFDKSSTQTNAIAELKPKLINQAQKPFLRELAQTAGIASATDFLRPLTTTLAQSGTTVKVVYDN